MPTTSSFPVKALVLSCALLGIWGPSAAFAQGGSLAVALAVLANGQASGLTLAEGQAVRLEVQATALPTLVAPGPMDWWVVAATPWGCYSYDGSGFAPGLHVAEQSPLYNGGIAKEVLNAPLPAGTFTLYFGADLTPDGKLDADAGYVSLPIQVLAVPVAGKAAHI